MSERESLFGRRWLRILARTGHIVAFGAVFGGHLFGASRDALVPWLYATVLTGVALMATDLAQSLRWLREVRGVAVLIKIALLLVIPFWWQARVGILIAVIVIASVTSHMPGRYRYWVIGVGPRPHRGGRG